MKSFRLICFLTALLICLCCGYALSASDIDIRSETIIRGFERRADNGAEEPMVPVYEHLGVDNGDNKQNDVSLQYRKLSSQLNVSIDRPHIFAGVDNRSIDGLQFGKGTESNHLFHFLQNSDETLAIAGTDVFWQGLGPLDVGVRGRRYTYDVREETAVYVAGLLTFNITNGSQIGVEIGRMDGDTTDNLYDLYRGFFYWQQPFKMAATGFISGDALYVSYDAPVFGQKKSVHYTVSAGRKFLKNKLETKLSGIYSQDPYFNSDVGGLVTLQIQY